MGNRFVSAFGIRHLWASWILLGALAFNGHAELLFTGDPAKGSTQWKLSGGEGNCGTGTISAVADADRGTVFKYNKPAGSNRCENHGIRVGNDGYVFKEGNTYFFGWWSMLSSTANNNANFQWKSYENHIQNFPIILKMIGGKMHLQYRAPGKDLVTVWSTPMEAGAWHHYVLSFHLSKDPAVGWIECWFDGKQQQTTNGTTRYPARSYDSGDHNCPKWGIYGGQGTAMSNFIDDLKVGTDYNSVAMFGETSHVFHGFGARQQLEHVMTGTGGRNLRIFDLNGRNLPARLPHPAHGL